MKTKYLAIFAATGLILTACAPAGKTGGGIEQGLLSPAKAPFVGQSDLDSTTVTSPTPVAPFPVDAKTFSSPWNRTDTQIIIDAYEGNSIDWDKMATDKRVTAVIHRASSGTAVDTQYKSRATIAKQRGYLWGAYHLGKSGDPIAQAKLYLKTIGSASNAMMFLDLEDTSNPTMMNIANAKIFLNYVLQQTDKLPVVYANLNVTLAINSAMKNDATFKQTRLWYARFKSSVTDFHTGNSLWPTYFLWQFSSEINCSKTGACLYNVAGTQYDMDVNVFYGSTEALAYQWSL
jgi:lysozyme